MMSLRVFSNERSEFENARPCRSDGYREVLKLKIVLDTITRTDKRLLYCLN